MKKAIKKDGRNKPKFTKSNIYEKYNLNETDKKVLDYKIRFETITHEEIAAILNCDRSTVTVILNKSSVKKVLNELNGSWIEILIKNKEKAARKLIRLVENPNPAIAIRACEDILQLNKVDLSDDQPEQDPY